MSSTFQIAQKDLWQNKRFALLFVFNLFLGLFGLSSIESFRGGIQQALDSRSKSILGADISVGARRKLTPDEQSILDSIISKDTPKSQVFEVFTMLSGPRNARLIEVKSFDPGYPFYGDLISKNGIQLNQFQEFHEKPILFVYPELLLQLELNVGDQLKIGDIEFTIYDTIEKDSGGAGSGFSFAPPVYVSRTWFEKTGLMKPGSTGYFSQSFQLPSSVNTQELAKLLNKKLTDPGIQITTNLNASEQVGRALGYLTDYLGLTSLVGLFLTSIGQFFIYRRFIHKKRKDIAIFKSIGMPTSQIAKVYLTQSLLLSLVSATIAIAASLLIMPLIEPMIYRLLQIDLAIQVTLRQLMIVLASACLGGVLAITSPLLNALQTQARSLFNEALDTRTEKFRPAIFAGMVIVFLILSIVLANSIRVGTLFTGLLLTSVFVTYLVGLAILSVLQNIQIRNLFIRLPLRQLTRERFVSVLIFTVLTMSTALLNLIPQISKGLRSELEVPSGLDVPSLFLFDIQQEQIKDLETFFQNENLKPMQVSPMVRARLTSINNVPFEKPETRDSGLTREEENENRFRNRGFNLTYRKTLSKSEKITKGSDFANVKAENPISIEERFADRLNIQIGDKLLFDIQGVEVPGTVVNFRHVRWTSFQPNFFLQFDEGPLNEAPQTYLLTLPSLTIEQKSDIQKKVIERFPNISIIDVSRVVERISSIIQQMTLALQGMALFTSIVGFFILFAIQNLQITYRTSDINMMKVLGADHSVVYRLFTIETFILSFLAVLFGTVLARILNVSMSFQLFEGLFQFAPRVEGLTAFLFLAFTSLLVFYLVHSVLKKKANQVFQSN